MYNIILKLSQTIDQSVKYQKTKSFFRSLLEEINYPYKKYFDWFMIFLILVSITILIAGKTVKIPQWLIEFDLYFITGIFALEYLLRLWISHDIHKHIIAVKEKEDSNRFEHYLIPLN